MRKGELNTGMVVLIVAVVALASISLGMVFSSETASIQPDDGAEVTGTFDEFGITPADIDSDFPINYFDTITEVEFDDDDVDVEGNATYVEEAGTIYELKRGMIGFDLSDYTDDVALEADFDSSDNFTDETTEVSEVYVYNDDGELEETLSDSKVNDLNNEETISLGGMEGDEYAIGFEFSTNGQKITAGSDDKVLDLNVELDSPDADSDEPVESGDFGIYVEGE